MNLINKENEYNTSKRQKLIQVSESSSNIKVTSNQSLILSDDEDIIDVNEVDARIPTANNKDHEVTASDKLNNVLVDITGKDTVLYNFFDIVEGKKGKEACCTMCTSKIQLGTTPIRQRYGNLQRHIKVKHPAQFQLLDTIKDLQEENQKLSQKLHNRSSSMKLYLPKSQDLEERRKSGYLLALSTIMGGQSILSMSSKGR